MYGPKQNEKSYAGVIPLTIIRILNREFPIIYGDGLQTRDYSFVEDIASVITKFYEIKETRNKIINLARALGEDIKRLNYKKGLVSRGLHNNFTNYEEYNRLKLLNKNNF